MASAAIPAMSARPSPFCSTDKTNSELYIQNVKDAAAVKELIHQQVEDMKIRRRVRFGEIASFTDDPDDVLDGDI